MRGLVSVVKGLERAILEPVAVFDGLRAFIHGPSFASPLQWMTPHYTPADRTIEMICSVIAKERRGTRSDAER